MAEVHEVLEVLEVASLVFGDATAARTWMTITLSHARDSRWVIMWWGGLGARMLARANGPDGKRDHCSADRVGAKDPHVDRLSLAPWMSWPLRA